MTSQTATVDTLTAEVRVLMVGNRQVTMSVFKQLDEVQYEELVPYGRVNPPSDDLTRVWVVGRHRKDGSLVRAQSPGLRYMQSVGAPFAWHHWLGHVPVKGATLVAAQAGDVRVIWENTPLYNYGMQCRAGACNCGDDVSELEAEWRQEASRMLEDHQSDDRENREISDLPLIVLAGLR